MRDKKKKEKNVAGRRYFRDSKTCEQSTLKETGRVVWKIHKRRGNTRSSAVIRYIFLLWVNKDCIWINDI